MPNIQYHSVRPVPDAVFSILIPTWNNLEYIKLCVESIRKHSRLPHQIILHVNEGSDGTLEWVREQGLDHTYSENNAGICFGMNAAATLATAKYLAYINDDMYVCPNWDTPLLEAIQQKTNDAFLFGAALIEPRDTHNPCVIFSDRFGNSIESFREQDLIEHHSDLEKPDWLGGGGAGIVVSRRLWDLVGGYSVEYTPGLYSDPDFSMKLWQAGVRDFMGVSQSRIFHFQCVSTGRIVKKNDGRKQFRRKWKISSNQFLKRYLKLANPYEGPLVEPKNNINLKLARLRGRL